MNTIIQKTIIPTPPSSINVLAVMKINGSWHTERLICKKKNEHFELVKPPFQIKHLAVGDLIKAEYVEEDGAYFIEHKIESAGNSTVQLQCTKRQSLIQAKKQLGEMGCECEVSYPKKRVAVNVPKEVDFCNIRLLLDMGKGDNRWEFEEACVSHVVKFSVPPSNPFDIERRINVWLIRFGVNLRQVRTAKYQSLEQVSRATNIPVDVLTPLEYGMGAKLEIGQFLRLAIYLGIEPMQAFI